MSNALIMKLENGARFTKEDRARLISMCEQSHGVPSRTDLICEGDKPSTVKLVLEGWACRYKTLQDGSRSIMAFLLPGDFCDLHVAILGQMDHSIATLSACTIVEIPRSVIEELSDHYPRIIRAFWWATLVDEGTLREWLVNMGRRPSNRQLAHLICELYVRLRSVGRADGQCFEFPVTQDELADTLGISAVHVNRTLQELREDGLIRMQNRTIVMPDWDRIVDFAEFSPNYLHLHDKAGTTA